MYVFAVVDADTGEVLTMVRAADVAAARLLAPGVLALAREVYKDVDPEVLTVMGPLSVAQIEFISGSGIGRES